MSVKATNIHKMFIAFQDKHVITNNTTTSTTIDKSLFHFDNIVLAHVIVKECHVCRVLVSLKGESFSLIYFVHFITNFY